MARTSLDLTQEVRFGVVMYGGVSLAIYINGVALELLSLVRATAAASGGDDGAALVDEPRGTEAVYRRLGQIVGASPDVPEDAPIRTRFVVDLVSGASAGGLNGIVLAKALANNQRLDQLKKLWFDEADIGVLLTTPRPPTGCP